MEQPHKHPQAPGLNPETVRDINAALADYAQRRANAQGDPESSFESTLYVHHAGGGLSRVRMAIPLTADRSRLSDWDRRQFDRQLQWAEEHRRIQAKEADRAARRDRWRRAMRRLMAVVARMFTLRR